VTSLKGKGKNDIIWGQAKSTSTPPEQEVNKTEEPTNLSRNIAQSLLVL